LDFLGAETCFCIFGIVQSSSGRSLSYLGVWYSTFCLCVCSKYLAFGGRFLGEGLNPKKDCRAPRESMEWLMSRNLVLRDPKESFRTHDDSEEELLGSAVPLEVSREEGSLHQVAHKELVVRELC